PGAARGPAENAGRPDRAFLRRMHALLRPGAVVYINVSGRHESLGRMLKAEGWSHVEAFRCFPSADRQVAVYPLGSSAARREVRRVLDPPTWWGGRLGRTLKNITGRRRPVENDVLPTASKLGEQGAAVWVPE